jgi:hypothetical protein
MMSQLVRGYWISGAVTFMKRHYPAEAAKSILDKMPRDVQSVVAACEPAQWYPRSHHVELMTGIAAVNRDDAAASRDLLAYGEHVGSELADGSLKPFLQVSTPKLLAKKLPDFWTRDHQDGSKLESDIAQLDEGRLPLRFSGLRDYDHAGIAKLGWIKSMLALLTKKPIRVKQQGWSLARPGPDEIVCEVSWQ